MFYNPIYSELNISVGANLLSSHVTKHIAAKTLSVKSTDLLIFIFNTVFSLAMHFASVVRGLR